MKRFYARLVVVLLTINAIAQLAMATNSVPTAGSVRLAGAGSPAFLAPARSLPQGAREPRHLSDPTTALVRVWVSESGWNSPADQRGIYEVLRMRAGSSHPQRITATARRYAGRTFPPHENPYRSAARSPRQQWVNELASTCAKPMSLDVSESLWAHHYRPLCKILFKRARLMLSDKLDDHCVMDMPVHHWGGPMDNHRARRAGWTPVRITCGIDEPRNFFWCDPRRADCGDVSNA